MHLNICALIKKRCKSEVFRFNLNNKDSAFRTLPLVRCYNSQPVIALLARSQDSIYIYLTIRVYHKILDFNINMKVLF